MESTPKSPDCHDQSRLPWLVLAAQAYRRIEGESYTETSFLRGQDSIDVLDKILSESSNNPNILLVGLGLDDDPLLCSYEAYRIAAHLQGKGVDYSMTLVDIDKRVISDITNRRKLFISYRHYDKKLAEKIEREWNKYLSDTHQTGGIVFEKEDGLNFLSYHEQENAMTPYTIYLEKGIATANIPITFQCKLDSGEISLIHDDIAVAPIVRTAPYDYTELTNVLYLMETAAQQLAFANISRTIKNGGRILMNDIGGYAGNAVLTRFNGWLNKEILLQLGLEVEEVLSAKERSETLLLRKI